MDYSTFQTEKSFRSIQSEKLLLSLASLFQEQGKYVSALPLVKRALALCERDLGPEHPHTQSVRHIYDGLQEMKDHPE